MDYVALVEAKLALDQNGRITGQAEHLYVLRTPEAVICRCHVEVPDEIATTIEDLSARERGRPHEWALEYGGYLRALASFAPIASMRAGPLYGFPGAAAFGDRGVDVDDANAAALLRGGLDEWLPDAASGRPMAAVVVDGRAVAVCASVVASKTVHEAGVETLPDYRRKGLGAEAVAAWARRIKERGATPLYATTFDNVASQGLARKLGLRIVGSEFSVDCARSQ